MRLSRSATTGQSGAGPPHSKEFMVARKIAGDISHGGILVNNAARDYIGCC
jgi:hypothetical protein